MDYIMFDKRERDCYSSNEDIYTCSNWV